MPPCTRSRAADPCTVEAAEVLRGLIPSWPRNCSRNRVSAPIPNANSCPVADENDRPVVSKKKAIRSMKRGSWTLDNLNKARDDVEDGLYSLRKAARLYGIPHTTLRNHVFHISKSKCGKRPKALTWDEEENLVHWCLQQVAEGWGVTVTMLRQKVADLCAGRITPFKNGVPGLKWWRCFRNRHPDLALRKAQIIDNARAIACSKPNLDAFYASLREALDLVGNKPDHIWNCDESGVQAGKESGVRVLARKGAKQISERTMANREWLTVLSCVNANGEKLPNLYILKGVRAREDYLEGCEPEAAISMQKKAWMTKDIFKDWVNHFRKKVPGGVSAANPHLLILDGHGSHVSLETVKLAAATGLHILKLPPHTSHRLQPLDVSCFRPFKEAFRHIRHRYCLHHAGSEPPKEDLTSMVREALDLALSPANIRSGFEKTGIYPYNPNKVQPELGGLDVQIDGMVNVDANAASTGNANANQDQISAENENVEAAQLQRKRRKTFIPRDIAGTLLVTKADLIATMEKEEAEKKEKKRARLEASERKKQMDEEKKKKKEQLQKEKDERKRMRQSKSLPIYGPRNHPVIEARAARASAMIKLREKRARQLQKEQLRKQQEDINEEDYAEFEDALEEVDVEERNVQVVLSSQANDVLQDSQLPESPSQYGCSLEETHECYHGTEAQTGEESQTNNSDIWHSNSPSRFWSIDPADKALGICQNNPAIADRRASKRIRTLSSLYSQDYVHS